MMSRVPLAASFVVLLLVTLFLVRTSMSANPTTYAWTPYDAAFVARMDHVPLVGEDGEPLVRSVWLLRPLETDPKIRESRLFVQVTGTGGRRALYKGPFADRIEVAVPREMPRAEVAFYAVHGPSKMSSSWSSLSAWPLVDPDPLVVELFDECREDTDSWYSITPAEGR